MSAAGPVVPPHPPAGPWAAAGAGGSDGDDDPALPRRRQLKSAHEADLEPIRGPGRHLTFACEPCLAFETEESVRAHYGNRSDVFMSLHVDPRYVDDILVEAFTLAQYAAIVRAARGRQGPR